MSRLIVVDGRRSRPVLAGDGQEDKACEQPRHAANSERRPRGRGGEEAAQRRTDELVAGDLGGVQLVFAFDKEERSTSEDRIDCADVANSVSPTPSTNAVA